MGLWYVLFYLSSFLLVNFRQCCMATKAFTCLFYLSGAREPWDWHREDYCLQKNSNFGKSHCDFKLVLVHNWWLIFFFFFFFWEDISDELWNDVPQNEEDISYMFDDETTPVKACGDLAYNVNNSGKAVHWQAAFLMTWRLINICNLLNCSFSFIVVVMDYPVLIQGNIGFQFQIIYKRK